MDLYDTLTAIAEWLSATAGMLIAGLFVVLLYFLGKRRAEFSRHAIENTAATILVFTINVGAGIVFVGPINRAAQTFYDHLGIPHLPTDFWSGNRLILGFVVAILLKDLCDYLIHRAMHTRWLWPAHAAHHSDTYVNGFTTFRIHSFEAILMAMNYLILLTWLQLPELIPIITVLMTTHNIYVHLDLDWGHGPFRYLLASPRFHRWHHADLKEVEGKNLANIFPFYDLLFGTYYDNGVCREPMGARSTGLEDKNPILIWIYPFLAWGKMLRKRFRRLMGQSAGTRLPPAE